MISAGILRRAMLAVAATGAALACLSLASATVAVVPAAIDLPGGTSVPTPSSHVRTGGGGSGGGGRTTGARHRAAGAVGAAATPATGGLFGIPGSGPPAAGLSSRPLSRSAPLDVSVRHALSSAAHQVGRFDPRVAIREATGWRPSLVTMTLLVIAFGLLVFASGSVAIMRGGRDQRPAG